MREVECRNAECEDFERAKDRGLGNESLVFALLFSSRYSRISQLKKKETRRKKQKEEDAWFDMRYCTAAAAEEEA